MPYDIATQAALDRYSAATCTSYDLPVVQNDPQFKAILAEENAKVVSRDSGTPFTSTACPLKAKTENPACKVSHLEIKKGVRTLKVDESNSGAVFEIVGGNLDKLTEWIGHTNPSPAKVEVHARGQVVKGPCKGSSAHKDRTFDIPYQQLKNVRSKSDAVLKMECFSDWALFPWLAKPLKYPVKYNTCSRSLNAEIHVYPDIEFGFGFEFKYQRERGRKFTDKTVDGANDSSKADVAKYMAGVARIEAAEEKLLVPVKSGRQFKRIKRAARAEILKTEQEMAEMANAPSELEWTSKPFQKEKITDSFSWFGFYKFSGQEIELKHVMKRAEEKARNIESVVKKVDGIVGMIQDLRDKSEAIASENAELKITQAKSGISMTYPTLGGRVSALWQELDDRPECEYGVSFAFFAKPLFGLEFKYDITYAILNLFGALGKTVAEIKSFMEKQDISTMAIVLSMNTKINLETKLELTRGMDFNNLGVTVQAEASLKLEIKVVQFRKKVMKFIVVVDIGGSGESGIVATVKMVPGKATGDLEWTGIKVTLVSNTTVTKSEEKAGSPPPKASAGNKEEIPKVLPYKGEKNGSETKTKENEKTFKLKGERWDELFKYEF